jgi:hypothetical protein
MNDYCEPASNEINVIVNALLHVFILFTILSLFYIFYIRKVEENAFNSEINNAIQEKLVPNVNELVRNNPSLQGTINAIPFTSLKRIYSKEDVLRANQNEWVKKSMIATSVTLFLILATILLVLKQSCGICVPITEILLENLISFVFIGAVEFLFFVNVAFKFVPVQPSYMGELFKSDVMNIFLN